MSTLLEKLFGLAMDTLPYTPYPAKDEAEDALEDYLDPEGLRLLRAYNDACGDQTWEDLSYLFYTGLALGIELAALTPSAAACRRT